MDKEKLEKGLQVAKDVGTVAQSGGSAEQSNESPERQAVDEIEGRAKAIGDIATREGKKAIEKLIKEKLNAPPGAQPSEGEQETEWLDKPIEPAETVEAKKPTDISAPSDEPIKAESSVGSTSDRVTNEETAIIEHEQAEKPSFVKEYTQNIAADTDSSESVQLSDRELQSSELEVFDKENIKLDTVNTSTDLEAQQDSIDTVDDTVSSFDTSDDTTEQFDSSAADGEKSNFPSGGSEDTDDTYLPTDTENSPLSVEEPEYETKVEGQEQRPSYVMSYKENKVKSLEDVAETDEDELLTDTAKIKPKKKEDWQLDTIETDHGLSVHNPNGVALQTADSANAALATADGAGLVAGETAVQTADMAAQAGEAIAQTGEVVAETSAEAAGAAATAGVTVAVSAAKKIGEKVKDAIVEATKQVKEDGQKGLGTMASFLMIPIIAMAAIISCSGFTGFGTASNKNLSDSVIALMPKIQAACEKYNISEYAPLVAAVMMQESGGNIELVHGDVMQCAESMGYPAGTPIEVDDSIDHGTGLIANLLSQVGCTGVTDINAISLALQSYNFGPGFISWAQQRGGYSKENAVAFAEYMAAQMGWSGYGDSDYVDHVMRYYSTTGQTGELGPESLLANGAFGYPCGDVPWITYDNHEGIDIQVGRGTPVYACASGIVNYVQTGYTEGVFYDSGSLATYGNCVFISHGDDWETRYAHLSVVTVSSGSYVQKGQLIGYSGNTGNSYGAHLHLALYYKGSPGSNGIIYAAQAWPHLHQ